MDKNCFAVTPVNRKCAVLKNNFSCGPSCPFRKSKMDAQVARRKADWRLAHLSETTQWYISEKYYKGKRPWLTTGRKAVSG